jgi:hypothetical protein
MGYPTFQCTVDWANAPTGAQQSNVSNTLQKYMETKGYTYLSGGKYSTYLQLGFQHGAAWNYTQAARDWTAASKSLPASLASCCKNPEVAQDPGTVKGKTY